MNPSQATASWATGPIHKSAVPHTTPARKLPKEQWQQHREIIEAMYVMPGVTAKGIIMMLKTHDFVVTERQLKRKIQDWKLDKNVKSKEMKMIAHKQQRRRGEGKETIFRVRGQPVAQAKIDRFQKRIEAPADTDVTGMLFALNSPAPTVTTISAISYETMSERGPVTPQPQNYLSPIMLPAIEASASSIRYRQAEEESLRHKLHSLDVSHSLKSPEILWAITQICCIVIEQSRHAAADSFLRAEIESRKITLDLDDSNSFGIYWCLAENLRLQSKITDACHLCKTIYEKTLVPSISMSAFTRANALFYYGVCLRVQGDMATAENLLRECIHYAGKFLQPDETLLLHAFRELSTLLKTQHKYTESEKMLREVAQAYDARFGFNHNDTLGALYSLAITLRLQNKYQEAEDLLQTVLASAIKILGPDSANTVRCEVELALVGAMIHADDTFLRETCTRAAKVLGKNHEISICAIHTLTFFWFRHNRCVEAASILEQTLAGREDDGNEDNFLEYLDHHNLLGLIYQDLGKHLDAIQLFQKCLDRFDQSFIIRNSRLIEMSGRLTYSRAQVEKETGGGSSIGEQWGSDLQMAASVWHT